jgi:hypothetical protein
VWLLVSSLLILGAASYPWLRAALGTPAGYHFWGGLWYSPDDSLLLSVMWEGLRGHWLHTPPYAMAEGPGALFYPSYVLLGHLCRWTGLSPVPVLHVTRLACGAVLLGTLYGFSGRFFPRVSDRRFAFLIAATGCGLGWILLQTSRFRSVEFSAPEVYPFFAILASLHVTLGLAALLWVLDALVPREPEAIDRRPGGDQRARRWVRLVGGGLVLAVLQPFGCVVAFAVGVLWASARGLRERRLPRGELASLSVLVVLTVPFVLHQLSTIAFNPAYAGWHTQVSTPTPPMWQVFLAAGLPLPFALVGLMDCARRRRTDDLLLLFWFAAMAVLLALPYYQSRRFDLGGYVPLAILAVRGVDTLGFRWSGGDQFLAVFLNGLSTLMILGATTTRVTDLDPELFVKQETWAAVRYLRDHAAERSVVLAEPVTSLAVLASSPLRVVFGHPAETPDSKETYRAVSAFFEDGRALPERLMRQVDYILVEPHGQKGLGEAIPRGFKRIFAAGDVAVYGRRR